jgi:hypothetical protein
VLLCGDLPLDFACATDLLPENWSMRHESRLG